MKIYELVIQPRLGDTSLHGIREVVRGVPTYHCPMIVCLHERHTLQDMERICELLNKEENIEHIWGAIEANKIQSSIGVSNGSSLDENYDTSNDLNSLPIEWPIPK